MDDKENDRSDFQPPRSKRKKVPSSTARFKEPTTDQEIAVLSKGFVPKNTQRNNTWALKLFQEWRADRNKRSEKQCPEDLLDPKKLDHWLSRFVTEVRKQDGQPYLPKTIHHILAALQIIAVGKQPTTPKFMDRNEPVFTELRRTCDSVYRQLHSDGVGTDVRHTSVFTAEEENALWSAGVLGINNPKSLQRAIFFYIGKRFCVRGGEEQHRLGPSCFKRTQNPDCYTYIEHGSKNQSGGLAELKVENKCVPCPAVPEKNPECLVFLLDLYLSKLPDYAFKEDILYCRPKAYTPSDDSKPWYDPIPVGRNKLSSIVKDMCQEAKIDVKSNHSLRATGATVMFQSNFPEHIIQKTTGHQSLDSLRMYERVSEEQHQAVSRIMMSKKPAPKDTTMQGTSCTKDIGKLFELTNCTIGGLTVNINPVFTISRTTEEVEEEFDVVTSNINLDDCFSL
jgi:hypothetical protein